MVNIAGRLKFFESFWQKLTNDDFVSNVIQGYVNPIHTKVYQQRIPNLHKFSETEQK